ncbi:hypothetical protein A33Q_1437 [Indibacter alkaliphilus LW1]|jgi:hypothetical protein|uniref:Uncharacterized protein n=1 Tax=Indibacter alkaliphilus (strain CCUG 57479 / KCTC 22604 / LW1) TaxID=1189612 RepID=S2E8Z3_INDAL|nr:hypothetical protein [Indibacter alkaliphilus]EOZ98783.1 hypothetical protein A33Q_1437 [Indibacter alkaliphilus LW1]
MELIFSLLFLMTAYFLTAVGLIQGLIPGGKKNIRNEDGDLERVLSAKRVLYISFLLASFMTMLMVYFFIFPDYRFMENI